MADDINVKPTPIQRNKFDVAVELVEFSKPYISYDNIEDIQNAFAKFYAIAAACERTSHSKLKDSLPQDLKKFFE
jgi:hypothetical protein